MRVEWIKAGLREVKRDFRRILDDSAGYVIDEAIAEIDSTKRAFDRLQGKTHHPSLAPRPWGYRIHPENPLRFVRSKDTGVTLWVDLYCTVLWFEEGALPIKQNIHLRVWSPLSNPCAYREEWDSEDVLDNLTSSDWPHKGRVMLRCHFDLAEPGQSGPQHHLQYGGNARRDELCWFPEIVKLPRFAYPPMDLVLACQLVGANFFWKEYNEFRKTPEWINALRRSQAHLLRDYFEGCLNSLGQDLLVDHLWNRVVEG